ncbi:trypsin-like peptidase domain-containing protein [Microbacterium sp. H1-D42]|uniref:S1C family serine protease n=1 Tax=Microbacterium sp. H1-D42 TaxID=2925844 RepID=UPI001F530484|nr:trypsin-like peptidase domain-containing protein [Microbacterium sp. H1-D42]UNK69749.1 trypsin-like peptidase domain-containing protein [Microbacterium sp. H1-D42]
MSDNNNNGQASNPEVPNVGATPTHSNPQTPAPDAGAQTPQAPQAPQAPAGHSIPATFGSHQQPTPGFQAPHAAPAQPGASFGASQQAHVPPYGAAQTAPIDSNVATMPQSSKKGNGTVKVAGLLLAAAIVGGVAGFGGSALGAAVLNQPVSQSASGPETVTVNNPGSVNETTAIASEVLPSVVTIEVAGQQESGSGSGVILDKEGHVLTNTHVVTLGGAVADPTIRVTTSDGHIYSATVVGTDPVYDLAVIKLEGAKDLKPIDFADSSKLNVGDTAVAVGAPLGLSNSVTTGIVSALNRSIQVASSALPDTAPDENQTPGDGSDGGDSEGGPFQFDIPGMGAQQAKQSISIAVIQTDAAINPGNSGGALVDSKGRLIGINVAIATAGNSSQGGEPGSIGLGFAIPSDIAKRVAGELIENGEATHGLLGATVRDASSVEGASVAGAVIVDPTAGGAAADAELRGGDIVTEFNGAPITSASDLTAQVRAAAAGSKAELTYVRSGKTYTTEVTLGELKL